MKTKSGDFGSKPRVGMSGVSYSTGDYVTPGTSGFGANVWDQTVGIFTGETSVGEFIGNVAYDFAMKEVSKYADIVKAFANKAVDAANAVSAQYNVVASATTQEQGDAALKIARDKARAAKNEASNAAKNFSLTNTAMKALLSIKGLPQSVVDGANRILSTAKSSLDKANNAVNTAEANLSKVEDIHSQKYGTFLTNLPGMSFIKNSPYGNYILIGGGIVALGLIGLVTYKIISKKKK